MGVTLFQRTNTQTQINHIKNYIERLLIVLNFVIKHEDQKHFQIIFYFNWLLSYGYKNVRKHIQIIKAVIIFNY